VGVNEEGEGEDGEEALIGLLTHGQQLWRKQRKREIRRRWRGGGTLRHR